MAAIAYKFLDAISAVWMACLGQKYVETEVGADIVKAAINRAQAEIPQQLASLMFAGGLYGSYNGWTPDGATDAFSFASGPTDPVLVPSIVEVIVNNASTPKVYGTALFATPERVLAMSRTSIGSSKNFSYGFLGNNILMRPFVPTGGKLILHYIKVPTLLSADTDALDADPRLFRAICLHAAWQASQKIPAMSGDRVEQLHKDFTAEMGRLEQLKTAARAEEYELRTGRDITLGGGAAGAGG